MPSNTIAKYAHPTKSQRVWHTLSYKCGCFTRFLHFSSLLSSVLCSWAQRERFVIPEIDLAGLLTHMEHMRMDPKHQFAAQYVLSRAAAERRERETLLAAVSASASSSGLLALTGMGGGGKPKLMNWSYCLPTTDCVVYMSYGHH